MHAARDTVIRPGDNPYLAEAAAIRFGEPDPAVVQSLAAAGDRGALGHCIEQLQRARDTLAVRYAHAIPDEDALETLAELAPLVELGAGTGYWAWLLRARGVDILAFDACPPIDAGHNNLYHRSADTVGTCWTTVLPGGPELAAAFPERTLFFCWPPDPAWPSRRTSNTRGGAWHSSAPEGHLWRRPRRPFTRRCASSSPCRRSCRSRSGTASTTGSL